MCICGELGIRTPGPVTVNSFQDCRNRPLCQLSVAKVRLQILKTTEFYNFYKTVCLNKVLKNYIFNSTIIETKYCKPSLFIIFVNHDTAFYAQQIF